MGDFWLSGLIKLPPNSAESIDERQLHHWRLIDSFRKALQECVPYNSLDATWGDCRRLLELENYLSLFLFGLINPVFQTMRSLCAGSELKRVQQEICSRRVSLGSFSEAQHVTDVELLEKIFGDLAKRKRDASKVSPGALSQLDKAVLAIDSSLWRMLPRMQWATWRHQSKTQRAMRLHVAYNVLDEKVAKFEMTAGTVCERKAWKRMVRPGEFYVGDRNYGESYQLLDWMSQRNCGYLVRLRQDAQWQVEEELPLSPEDQSAAVVEHVWARLGVQGTGPRVRIIVIQGEQEQILLATNQEPQIMNPEEAGELYRKRWQVEMFFRWIKCTLGCRHWLAESEQGVATQIYLALIAALLLSWHDGRRVNKREMEFFQAYMMGWASEAELKKLFQKIAAKRACSKIC